MPMSEEARKAASERMKAMHEAKKAQQTTATAVAEPEATAASTQAGIEIPPAPSTIRKPTIIRQLSDEELENDLEAIGLDDWLMKHHDKMDANYDTLARVAHLDGAPEVRDRLKTMGVQFPPGA